MAVQELPFKIVALDLDGTLLDDDKKVSPLSRKVLQTLDSMGVTIVLASGRAASLMEPTADASGVDCMLISYNGAQCLRKRSDGRREVFTNGLPRDCLQLLFSQCEAQQWQLNVYLEIVYSLDDPALRPLADAYARMTGAQYKFVSSYSSLLNGALPIKCLIITSTEDQCQRVFDTMRGIMPSNIHMVKSRCHTKTDQQYYVEFLKVGSDKGSALRTLCKELGVVESEVVAFGDADNDLEMITTAGLGVSMAHGSPAIKRAANKVSEYTNTQDGVARELIHLFHLPEPVTVVASQ